MQTKKFSELNISREILKAIVEMGFEIATPIQTQAIPLLLEGKDIIGQAMTGTGKTVAFAIPAIETIDPKVNKPQVLILCPTRELATQVAIEIGKLSKFKENIHELPIYGGQPIDRQIKALKRGPQIIVGTPGRILDHLERGTINFNSIKTIILDEADEMLNMGFVTDIETILKSVPKERQTVLFSATMSKTILNLTKKYQRDPQLVKITHEKFSIPKIEQEYFEVNGTRKLDVLLLLLETQRPFLSLVFCNTKRMVDNLVTDLNSRGHYAQGLHGDMPQNKRNKVMEKFKKGETEILVATDVAARGIDVENIDIVFNYDIPQDEEYYVHRIGRTGRAGKTGKAYTFVYSREIYFLKSIEKYTQSTIKRGKIPLEKEVRQLKIEKVLAKIKDVIKNNDLTQYASSLEQTIGTEFSMPTVAAALLKMQLSEAKKPKVEEKSKIEERPKKFFSKQQFHRKKRRF